MQKFDNVGSYISELKPLELSNNNIKDNISVMSSLFGALWEERYKEKMLNSENVIGDLFTFNNLNLQELIKDKRVIDIGCGSGRFSIALAKIGASEVKAVDINSFGLDLAKKYANDLSINNIEFIHHNVLELPFKDESFDFVFSKGVLHHTGNLNRGIHEYSRVLKKEDQVSYTFMQMVEFIGTLVKKCAK